MMKRAMPAREKTLAFIGCLTRLELSFALEASTITVRPLASMTARSVPGRFQRRGGGANFAAGSGPRTVEALSSQFHATSRADRDVVGRAGSAAGEARVVGLTPGGHFNLCQTGGRAALQAAADLIQP